MQYQNNFPRLQQMKTLLASTRSLVSEAKFKKDDFKDGLLECIALSAAYANSETSKLAIGLFCDFPSELSELRQNLKDLARGKHLSHDNCMLLTGKLGVMDFLIEDLDGLLGKENLAHDDLLILRGDAARIEKLVPQLFEILKGMDDTQALLRTVNLILPLNHRLHSSTELLEELIGTGREFDAHIRKATNEAEGFNPVPRTMDHDRFIEILEEMVSVFTSILSDNPNSEEEGHAYELLFQFTTLLSDNGLLVGEMAEAVNGILLGSLPFAAKLTGKQAGEDGASPFLRFDPLEDASAGRDISQEKAKEN